MQSFVDINPLLVLIPAFLVVVTLFLCLHRREESFLKKLGFVRLKSVDEELRELTITYFHREPAIVYAQSQWSSQEPTGAYYLKLESTGDEGQPLCIAVRMATDFRKRIIIYRFYGSKWLFRVVKKLFFRFEYSYLKKIPLAELTEFNEQYLDQYGLFAFGDEDFDLQDAFFQRIIHSLCNVEPKRVFTVGLLERYLIVMSDSRRSLMSLWERLQPIL
jgi:hypothetical protein